MKAHHKRIIGAGGVSVLGILAIAIPKAIDIAGDYVKARIAVVEDKAKDESQWSLVAFTDLKEEIDTLKAEVARLKHRGHR